MMWKRLLGLQKESYGEESRVIVFTLKNVGTCYLGIGQAEAAKKTFEECITLINKLAKPTDKEEF